MYKNCLVWISLLKASLKNEPYWPIDFIAVWDDFQTGKLPQPLTLMCSNPLRTLSAVALLITTCGKASNRFLSLQSGSVMQPSGRTQPLDTLEMLCWDDYSESASNYQDCFPQRKRDFDVGELSQNSWRYNKILSETSINSWHWHIRSQDNIYQEPDKPEASSSLIILN